MKIRDVEIKNYRSLKHIKLEDIGNLNIIVGANSSGKTNLLEALFLFFNELDPALDRNIGAINDEFLWFDRDPKHPIEFRIKIEISSDLLLSQVPEDLQEFLIEAHNIQRNGTVMIEIKREIHGTPQNALWRTRTVSLNGEDFISEGKSVVELVKLPPTGGGEAKKIPQDFAGNILQAVSRIFKGKFILVNASRNMPSPLSGLSPRSPFIPQPVIAELVRLGQSFVPRKDEKRLIELQRDVGDASAAVTDIRIVGGQLTIREENSDMHFPINAVGGGHQELLGLLFQLQKEEPYLFGVEEPETHLHPELARRLLAQIKERYLDQQIFIVTHSTVFIDQAELSNTWVSRKMGKETKFDRIKDASQLKNLLYDLGARPSDLFFSNAIIFVEGQADREFFPVIARKIELDLHKHRIALLPTYGKAQGKYHLNVWLSAAQNTDLPFFMIFDKGASKETKKFPDQSILKQDDNLFFLKKGDIEDYYPGEKLIEALNSEFALTLTEEEKEKVLIPPRVKNIEDLLNKKKIDLKGWKVNIARVVANEITPQEIDEELLRILERISTKLKLGSKF